MNQKQALVCLLLLAIAVETMANRIVISTKKSLLVISGEFVHLNTKNIFLACFDRKSPITPHDS